MKLKRITGLILSVLLTGSICVTPMQAQGATAHPDLLIGDADCDGEITVSDATAIQSSLAELTTLDEQAAQLAKTDFSREDITISDVTILQKHLAEYDEDAPREVGKAAMVWKTNKYVSAEKEYASYINLLLKSNNIGGVAYAVRNGRVLGKGARGKQNTAENKPMSIDTLFPIGSVSKQFCAAAVLLLQEQGKLSVNDTLGKYFPEYVIGKDITLHFLLAQRSGIRDYGNIDQSGAYPGHENPLAEYALGDNAAENRRAVTEWLFTQELQFQPGSRFYYSNSNYFLLANIVEQVTGGSYESFIKENIFEPLGMNRTGFHEEMIDSPDIAESKAPEVKNPEGILLGAGDIVSGAEDMDKWMKALCRGTLLSDDSTKAMMKDYSPNQYAQNTGYGYGVCVKNDGTVFHEGAVITYATAVMILPEENLRVFFSTNDIETLYSGGKQCWQLAEMIKNKVN